MQELIVGTGNPAKLQMIRELESIQIDPASGAYLSEMPPEELAVFWQQMIGRELCNFLRQVQQLLGD
jgi:hypothetical protein